MPGKKVHINSSASKKFSPKRDRDRLNRNFLSGKINKGDFSIQGHGYSVNPLLAKHHNNIYNFIIHYEAWLIQ